MSFIRNAAEVTVQGKKGWYVDSCYRDSIGDIVNLQNLCLYTYMVRHNESGTLVTLESRVLVNCAGYMVFKEPIQFPKRKNNDALWYGLTNGYSKISNRFEEHDISII